MPVVIGLKFFRHHPNQHESPSVNERGDEPRFHSLVGMTRNWILLMKSLYPNVQALFSAPFIL